jgi:hypothetical protein
VGQAIVYGVHAVAADKKLAAIGSETELARFERQRQTYHGLPGRDIEDGDATLGPVAGDQLLAIRLESDDRRLGAGHDRPLDGGAGQRRHHDAAALPAGDGGPVLAAQIEPVGKRGKAYAARRA